MKKAEIIKKNGKWTIRFKKDDTERLRRKYEKPVKKKSVKIQTIKEGNVVLPKDHKKLTVSEFYFISDYINKISAEFTETIKLKKGYKNKMKQLVKKRKTYLANSGKVFKYSLSNS